jgi:hypothetical protein
LTTSDPHLRRCGSLSYAVFSVTRQPPDGHGRGTRPRSFSSDRRARA